MAADNLGIMWARPPDCSTSHSAGWQNGPGRPERSTCSDRSAVDLFGGLRFDAAGLSASSRRRGARGACRQPTIPRGFVVVRMSVTSTKRKQARPPHRSAPKRASFLSVPLPDKPFPNPLAICETGPDGWTLLVNPDTAAAIAVNPTGALIWRLADGRRTVVDIVTGVRSRFPDAPDSVSDDVTAHLTTLAEAGLIGEEIPIRRTKDQGPRTED
jgi:hypothetical protein